MVGSMKVYYRPCPADGHMSTARSGNPWTKRGRGAVRWGESDYVLWRDGEAVQIVGRLVPGGFTEEQAREWVANGKLPEGEREREDKAS